MSRRSEEKKKSRHKGYLIRLLRKRGADAGLKWGFGENMVEYARRIFGVGFEGRAELYLYLEKLVEDGAQVPARKSLAHSGLRQQINQAFYHSEKWLLLRYRALTIYGRACMCCGDSSCPHVAHIRPRSKYPHLELNFNNLQILCHDCNHGKKAWDETDWRPRWAKDGYPLPKT